MNIKSRSKIIALCMAFTMLPMQAHASPTGATNVQDSDADSPAVDSAITGKVYFGKADLLTATDGSTTSETPALYRIMQTEQGTSGTSGTMTLFYDGSSIADGKRYDLETHKKWSGSEICLWLNDTFKKNAFTPAESTALVETYSNVPETENNIEITPNQTIVLPSIAEVKDAGIWGMTQAARKNSAQWWLRAQGTLGEHYASIVLPGGLIYPDGFLASTPYGVRPAFKLNLDAVLFASDAVDGKSGIVGANLSPRQEGIPTEQKLTILNDYNENTDIPGQKVTIGTTTQTGNKVRIPYSNATKGIGQHISAIIKDDTGKIKYYGKIADTSSVAQGEAMVSLPSEFGSEWTLEVFSEQINGNKKTDYASTPVAMNATPPERPAPPEPHINYANETVATSATWEYRVDTTDEWRICTPNMPATAFGWDGTAKTVSFRIAVTDTAEASEEVSLTIPARPEVPDASTFTITEPTPKGTDGTLDGITNTMEYKTTGAYVEGTDQMLTGIADGTVYTIRNKATATAFASKIVTVIISSKTPVAVTLADKTVDYNGAAQVHEAATTATGDTMSYGYTAQPGSALDSDGNPRDAGTYTVTAIYESDTEIGTATATLTIKKMPLTIKAENKSVYYGRPQPPLTLTYTGFVTGENETNALTGTAYTAVIAASTAPTGERTIVVKGNATAKNYTITTVSGTLTVITSTVTNAVSTMPWNPTTPTIAIPTESLPTDTTLADVQLSVSHTLTVRDINNLNEATKNDSGFAGKQYLEASLVHKGTQKQVQLRGPATLFFLYPSNTDQNNNIKLTHILTDDTSEQPALKKQATGIQFEISSTSPFAIGWTKDNGNSNATATLVSPRTGGSNHFLVLFALLLVSGGALTGMLIKRRKTNHKII